MDALVFYLTAPGDSPNKIFGSSVKSVSLFHPRPFSTEAYTHALSTAQATAPDSYSVICMPGNLSYATPEMLKDKLQIAIACRCDIFFFNRMLDNPRKQRPTDYEGMYGIEKNKSQLCTAFAPGARQRLINMLSKPKKIVGPCIEKLCARSAIVMALVPNIVHFDIHSSTSEKEIVNACEYIAEPPKPQKKISNPLIWTLYYLALIVVALILVLI